MVEQLVDELSKQDYHLLIEGTLRTTEVPRKTARLLKSRGYQVSLALIATKPELSYLSTLIRYEEVYAVNPNQARATPKEHHDGIVEHLVDNLRELETDKLFDEIQIYQRDRRCVYDSEIDDGSAAESATRMPLRKMEQGGGRDDEGGTGIVDGVFGNEKK